MEVKPASRTGKMLFDAFTTISTTEKLLSKNTETKIKIEKDSKFNTTFYCRIDRRKENHVYMGSVFLDIVESEEVFIEAVMQLSISRLNRSDIMNKLLGYEWKVISNDSMFGHIVGVYIKSQDQFFDIISKFNLLEEKHK